MTGILGLGMNGRARVVNKHLIMEVDPVEEGAEKCYVELLMPSSVEGIEELIGRSIEGERMTLNIVFPDVELEEEDFEAGTDTL